MKEKQILQDHLEQIAEELREFMGFDIKTIPEQNLIELDTIFGRMKFKPSEKTVMGDVYRFISNYGLKLHKWGLENKINEYSKAKTTPKD